MVIPSSDLGMLAPCMVVQDMHHQQRPAVANTSVLGQHTSISAGTRGAGNIGVIQENRRRL